VEIRFLSLRNFAGLKTLVEGGDFLNAMVHKWICKGDILRVKEDDRSRGWYVL